MPFSVRALLGKPAVAPGNAAMPGEARCLRSGRATIEYFAAGSGPVVVLLPALAANVREFAPLVARLNAAGFRTLAIQQPGIGRSRRPFFPGPTLYDFAADVAHVLDDAGVSASERVIVLGRGLGNRIARAFATKHPQRTAGVILLGAGGQRRGRPPLRVIWRYMLLQCPWLTTSQRRRLLEPLLCARREVLPDFACRRPPWRALILQGGAAGRTNWRGWWSGGDAPLFVLQGEEDRVARPEFAHNLAREFPGRVQLAMIPGAGHALLYDAPAVVTEQVLQFLQTQPLATAVL